MALTLADANRMIQAAVAKAEELNMKMCVAVCDAGGRLIAFSRMDGAMWTSTYAAQGKAVAAAGFGRASGAVPADSPVVHAIIADEGGHMIPGQGGLPVFRDGELIGAVGGSGGDRQQQDDEDCARAGIDAL